MSKLKFIAKVISLGRVTIPEEIRQLLNIKDGDLLEVEVSKVKKEVKA
jgi:AbrB family looped-hinge helix DNA binding protein